MEGRTLRNDGNSTDLVDQIASLYLLSTNKAVLKVMEGY